MKTEKTVWTSPEMIDESMLGSFQLQTFDEVYYGNSMDAVYVEATNTTQVFTKTWRVELDGKPTEEQMQELDASIQCSGVEEEGIEKEYVEYVFKRAGHTPLAIETKWVATSTSKSILEENVENLASISKAGEAIAICCKLNDADIDTAMPMILAIAKRKLAEFKHD